MIPDHVDDAEHLFRSVRPGEYVTNNGKVIFSASAFNDRDRKPSVDRSEVRRDPKDALKSPTDGIAKLIAAEVRSTSKIAINNSKGAQIGAHSIDVKYRPIKDVPDEPDNLAHCQIECDPLMDNDNRFKRLKESLAAIATKHGFVVPPS